MADCNKFCHTIYDRGDGHTQQRDRRILLGNKAQFCDAFYHVHEWSGRRHSCLDENICTIARRARSKVRDIDWTVQPLTVVALAKFEVDGDIKYVARYTNCHARKKHAEDHFDSDIRTGMLGEKIRNAAEGNKLITLYLTYQPCNKSTGETTGTTPNQSCCEILKKVYSDVLEPQNIALCVKATHTRRLHQAPAEKVRDEVLRKNAVGGIQQLIESGVNVSGMNEEDWAYLFGLTDANITGDNKRKGLDETIKGIFSKISTWNIE